MRDLVFFGIDSEEKRSILNKITHSFVLAETEKRIEKYSVEGREAVIADVPLMFESGFDKRCDVLIAVVADENVRISRIIERDGISFEQAKARIAVQISTDELVKRVDFVIDNNSDMLNLENKIDNVYKQIFEK